MAWSDNQFCVNGTCFEPDAMKGGDQPDEAGRKSGCGDGRPDFRQEMKISSSNSTPFSEMSSEG